MEAGGSNPARSSALAVTVPAGRLATAEAAAAVTATTGQATTSAESAPATALTADERGAARYVGVLFGVSVAVQRFSVPGLNIIELLLPVVLAWAGWGLHRGVFVINHTRLVLWTLAAGACALTIPVQVYVLNDTRISVNSYALFLLVWLPTVVQLRHATTAGFLLALRMIARVAVVLAVICVAMIVSQLAGLAYQDWLATALPENLLLQNFVITYPMSYGVDLYRANAWIGLEPSIVSLQLGIGFMAALLTRRRWPTLTILAAGILCTAAGSGMAIIIVGVSVVMLHRFRDQILRYLPAAVFGLALSWFLPWGVYIYSRLTEFTNPDSSTSLRGVTPYQYLWQFWVDPPVGILFGHGPGSSQARVTESQIVGLLVPTPAKIFFDYGLIAGLLLAVVLLFCYTSGPSRSFAVTLAVSLWLIQPGTTVTVIVVQVFLLVTWWSPRVGAVLESQRGSGQPWHR